MLRIGEDITISALAVMIKKIVGYEGAIVLDKDRPDGTPQKLMDVSKLSAYGWNASIGLEEGITNVYKQVQDNFK